jgi:hypothetical protein
VRAPKGCILAEKIPGPLLFDHLPSVFSIPQETAKKARTRSIPNEKPASFPGACAPFFCQFTLELFGSALPVG